MEYCSLTEPSKRISDLITLIKETHDVLHRESNLTPLNYAVTKPISIFTEALRQAYTPEEVKYVMGNVEVTTLQKGLLAKLSEAEYQMELFDSRHLCHQPEFGLASLFQYKNWGNYESLVGEELKQLRKISRPEEITSPIVFVGSGPLPLSALLLHLRWNVSVICLDIDPDACKAARFMMERINLSENVQVVHRDGAEFDYADYQHVFIASLVTQKDKVLEQIRQSNPGALVAIRTAEGIRRLMYEAINEEAIAAAGWQLLGRTSPIENRVINSARFYRLGMN
ncbi:nicotianamine synthase [Paenibacillus sp. 5J-6]|uniref:Nicotianamine synthase n=1 Tax=Paenibacillus silvestris TaxID=2606219 RepID=A0A6L8VBP2_9BACL|nr:nicotianamine synthase family protein [Paenibacillus silvestris]MZQ86749.1 nicotianamine synthase [Paenibacillus silvestris]